MGMLTIVVLVLLGAQDLVDLQTSAERKLKAGDAQGALRDYTAILERVPTSAPARAGCGDAKLLLKDFQGALQDFEAAAKLDPGSSRYLAGQGRTLGKLKKFDLALTALNKAIDLDSTNARAFQERGNWKFATLDYDGAIADLTVALRLEPGNAELFAWRGFVRTFAKDDEHAVEDLTQAFQRDPKTDPVMYLYRARAYHNLYRYAEALDDYTLALEKSGETAAAYADRARCLAALHRLPKARADVARALELDPNLALAHAVRGEIEIAEGKIDLAIAAYEASLKISPRFSNLRVELGCLRWLKGDRDGALRELAEARDTAGDRSALARAWIYIVKARNGDPDARTELEDGIRPAIQSNAFDWYLKPCRLFLGEDVEKELARSGGNEPQQPLFYLGMQRLLAGKDREARKFFRQCLETKKTDYYALVARAELERIPKRVLPPTTVRGTVPESRLVIPAGYESIPPPTPKVANTFVRIVDEEKNIAVAINLEDLGGTLGRESLGDADVAAAARQGLPPGATMKMIQEKWGEFEINVMESWMVQDGVRIYGCVAQVPLAPRALQISVGAPEQLSDQVRADLRAVLATVQGRTNWLSPADSRLALAAGGLSVIGLLLWLTYGFAYLVAFRNAPEANGRLRMCWLLAAAVCFFGSLPFEMLYTAARGRAYRAYLVPVMAVICLYRALQLRQRVGKPAVALAGGAGTAPAGRRPISPVVAGLLTFVGTPMLAVFTIGQLAKDIGTMTRVSEAAGVVGLILAICVFYVQRSRYQLWETRSTAERVRDDRERSPQRLQIPRGRRPRPPEEKAP